MIKSSFHSQGMRATAQRAATPGGMPLEEPHRKPPEGAAPTILELDRIKVTFPLSGYIEKKNKFLEENRNKEKSDNIFYKAIEVKCKSWLCKKCRVHKGLRIREKFIAKSNLFESPRLYTITINREWFDSPADAYNYVMQKKFLARLLTKEMNVRRWIWVLEPQENNGDGWPHWHILIDVADLPGMWYNKETKKAQENKPQYKAGWCYVPHFFDLNKVHRLLRKWKIGEQCKLTVKRDNFCNPLHAIRYITKYLIKTPERGFPPWMLKYSRLRFVQASRDIGSLGGQKYKPPEKKDDEGEYEPRRKSRRPVERIAECAKQIIFSSYDPDLDKSVFTEPIWGLRKSIEIAPGAVSVEDFDFKRQKSFTAWGFNSLEDIWRFQDIWKAPRLVQKLNNNIKNKKEKLLSMWDKTRAV